MVNTERVDIFNDSSAKYISGKSFSNRKLESEQADHSTALYSHNGKSERKFSKETETFTLPESIPIKEAIESNITKVNSHFSDCDLSEWKQVKPKGRKKSPKNTKVLRDIKTNENFRQKLKQERLKSPERHAVNFNESMSQKRIVNGTSGLKAKSFASNKSCSNRTCVKKNSENNFSNVNQISPDKCDEKENMDRNEKLNVRGSEQLNSRSIQGMKQRKSEGIELNTKTDKHVDVNSNCQLKNTGAIPKRSRYTQTLEEAGGQTDDFVKPADQNMNETMNKLKLITVNKDLMPELTNLGKQMVPKKPCKRSLNEIRNETQMNEYLETIPTNPEPNLIEESINFREINEKANHGVEKLDSDVYQLNNSLDLTKSETMENLRLDISDATGIYQQNECTSHSTNEDETVERIAENFNATETYEYLNLAPRTHFPLPTLFPLQQYITNSQSKLQFESFLASERDGERFDNGRLCDMNQSEFPNSYDPTQSTKISTVHEQCSKNATNESLNFNGFVYPNVKIRCVQYDPFILELSYRGVSYYQEIDCSAWQYPCVFCPSFFPNSFCSLHS